MCVALAKALGKSEHETKQHISDLEAWSGWPSEDLRLVSDLAAKNNQKISSIDLDPSDTTAEELFNAINAKYKQTQKWFGQSLGVVHDHQSLSFESFSQLVKHIEARGVLSPRQPILRKLVGINPPKITMKILGYRSNESMQKRENPVKILALAELCESAIWKKNQRALLKKLLPADYEYRSVKLFVMDRSSVSKSTPSNPPTTASVNYGAILAWPSLAKGPQDLTDLFIEVIKLIEEVSSGINKHEFGFKNLSKNVLFEEESEITSESIAGTQRNQTVSAKLASLHPAFAWWRGNDFLIFTDKSGHSVSLSVLDASRNSVRNFQFRKRSLKLARQELYNNLHLRYLQYPNVQKRHAEGSDLENRSFSKPSEKYRQLKIKYNHLGFGITGTA